MTKIWYSPQPAKTLSKPVQTKEKQNFVWLNSRTSWPMFSFSFRSAVDFNRPIVIMQNVLMIFVLCCVILITAQSISLDIPQHHSSESHQSTFTTYKTKKYFFLTFFKVSISWSTLSHQFCLKINFFTGQFLWSSSVLSAEQHGAHDHRLQRRRIRFPQSDQWQRWKRFVFESHAFILKIHHFRVRVQKSETFLDEWNRFRRRRKVLFLNQRQVSRSTELGKKRTEQCQKSWLKWNRELHGLHSDRKLEILSTLRPILYS